ncbi:MAG: ribonuclease Z [Bacteroidia bacterium]|nr:ribonuclease Z [Bacteroidia bacterium]
MSQQKFEVLILGSSAASPTDNRNVSGQLLNVSERLFLIDCGEGTQMQLRKYKVRIQSIDHILISHLHGDHFFGLPGLLSSMHLLGRKQPINLYCPKELKPLMVSLFEVSETWLNFEINWIFTNNNGLNLLFEDGKVELHSFPLKHRIYCTGFLFREKPLPRKIDKFMLEKHHISVADILLLKNGEDVVNENGELIKNSEATHDPSPPRSYAYCSDTVFDPDLLNYINKVDLLYHESTFLNDHVERAKKTMHSTAAQAAEIANRANVGQLLLGHFSARYRELEDFRNETLGIFDKVTLAVEGNLLKI